MTSTEGDIIWPKKQRELTKFVADSRRWNDFRMRPDDIVISTWSKSGTTWMQQIVGQLIFGGVDRYCVPDSPYVDFLLREGQVEKANAQMHRRFLKTHLPIDAIPYSPDAKYIYVARDARDTFWSWYNHWSSYTPEVMERIRGLYPGNADVTYPDEDIRAAFHEWLDTDGEPYWPFWSHVQGWFDWRHLPNLKLVHFANLKADLAGELRSIAAFLDISIDPAWFDDMVAHCGFDYMREKAIEFERTRTSLFTDGATSFFHKGTNGRWKDILTTDDIARYEAVARRNLTRDAAAWLETGRLPV
jgi:aryl sulfotransferase